MSFGTVLHFDPATEDAVYELWDALDAMVERPMRESGVRPHVTLASSDQIDAKALQTATATFAASVHPFRLTLSSIGLFATDEGVLFLGVTVSRGLLEMHAEYNHLFARYARQPDAYYRLGAWVPHCTLAVGLKAEQLPDALGVARRASLPIYGTAAEMALLRVGEGAVTTLATFQLGARA